jgi:hypothetical protein
MLTIIEAISNKGNGKGKNKRVVDEISSGEE